MSHTPGPWKFHLDNQPIVTRVPADPDNGRPAGWTWTRYTIAAATENPMDEVIVGEFNAHEFEDDPKKHGFPTVSDPETARANAMLAAAAPELLEALVSLTDLLAFYGVPEDATDKYEQALAAIAKARGES